MSNIDRAKAQLEEGLFDTDSSDDDSQNSSSSDDDGSDDDDTSLMKLKPMLKKGDRVVAAWWDLSRNERMNKTTGRWFAGKVHAVKERDRYGDSRASNYGPIRIYEIHYDDGDELEGILDVFVCPEKDHELENNSNSRDWKGVRNVKDKSSSDRYAKEIGWYVATIGGGEEKSFSTLYEAMKKADEYIIKIKKGDVRKSDLNLPNEWNISQKKKRGRPKKVDNEDDDKPTKKKKLDIKDLFDNTGSDSDEDMEEEEEGGSNYDSKSVNYTGAYYIKANKRYRSLLQYKDKQKYVGEYILQVDAAHARDEGCRALSMSGGRNGFNFNALEKYTEARSKEIAARGLSLQDAGSLSEVAAKMQEKIKKWGKSKQRNDDVDEEESEDESFVSDQDDEEGESDATYTGVSFIQATRRYRGAVWHNNKTNATGEFVLGADAAYSRDEFCRAVNKTNKGFNFNTEEEYKDARANEIKRRGLSLAEAGTLADMLARIQAKRTKWGESIQRNDDADDSSHSSSDDLPLIAMKHKPYRETAVKTSSDYHGVGYNQRQEKHWTVSIFYNGKDRFVGVYELESDAARVYDEVAAILLSNNDRNFATKSDHEKARKREAEKLGLSLASVVPLEESMEKAQIYLNSLLSGAENDGDKVLRKKRVTSPFTPILAERKERSEAPPIENVDGSGKKIADLNEAMSKKWGRRLPAAGSRFLESYQNSIEEMLGGVGGQSNNNTPIGTFVSISTVRSADGQEEHDDELDIGDNKMCSGEQQPPKYTGLTKRGKGYRSQIWHNGTVKELGEYAVGADAAHAYDEYFRAFNLSNRVLNFNTQQEYEEARAREIEERGPNFDSMGLAEVAAKINARIARIAKGKPSVQGDESTDDSPRSIDIKSSTDFEGKSANDQMENDDDEDSGEKKKPAKRPENLAGAGQETEEVDLSNRDEQKEAEEHDDDLDIGDNKMWSGEQQPPKFYTGVTKTKRMKGYRSRIGHNGTINWLGDYVVGADAAHAYDEYGRALNLSDRMVNFSTQQEYEEARAKEIEERGPNFEPMGLAEVASKINARIAKWKANVQGDESTDDSPRSIDMKSSSDFEGKSANDQMENDVDVDSGEKKKPAEWLENLAGSGHGNQETEEVDLSNRDEQKEAEYTGVSKLSGKNRYRGQIWNNGKGRAAGDFLLGADAAHARDVFCRSFNMDKPLNFNTADEYEHARAKEIERRGLTSDAADTSAKMKEFISLSEVAKRIEAKRAKWKAEAESKKSNTGADVLPKTKSSSKQTTQDDDSDDVSLFSEARDEQENFALSQHSAAVTVAASNVTTATVKPKSTEMNLVSVTKGQQSAAVTVTASNVTAATVKSKLTEMNLVSVTKEQEESLEFPIGCRVLWKLQDESFHRGVVSSAWLNMNPPIKLVYEVEPLDGKSKQKKCASVLAFDTHCPVYIKSSPTDNNSLIEGEVLLSRTIDMKTFYTILLNKEGNEFQLKQDVPSDLIRFRKITKEKPSPSRRVTNVSESNNKDLHSEQKSQTRTNSEKEAQPKELNSREKEVNGHCDMSISTSNSTISTRESVRMSTPRGRSFGNGARWDERSIDIELPRWFVSDNRVKDHLACKYRWLQHFVETSSFFTCLLRP